jgi:hypothetical protein
MELARIDFVDLESGSAAFLVIRRAPDGIALGFAVEANGDLDLAVSGADAQRLGEALIQTSQVAR